MNCYFCQQEMPVINNYNEKCESCTNLHNLRSVYTCDGDYAHIYIDKSIKTKHSVKVGQFFRTHSVQEGFIYHIRLHLKENHTKIYAIADMEGNDYRHLLDIPGFPITPANAKEKLNTYLAFL